MKDFWKSVLYLFLRTFMVCFLAFMTYTLVARFTWLAYVMAVFYFVVMMYFFVFTLWHEGGKDILRVKAGSVRYNPAKGFLSAGVVGVFMTVVYLLPQWLKPESVERSIAVVVRYFFMLPSSYASVPFVSAADFATTEAYEAYKASVSSTVNVKIAVFYFGFLAAWVIGAGIGYIVGYKEIKLIQPWLDKWKKD